MVVDDVEDNREVLRRRLAREGYDVTCASNGREALERIANAPFDLVLLDVMMPEMGGIEMLRRYRQNGGAAPVVMISGLDEPQTVVHAMRVGASDYVTKPLNAEELLETLERVVERNPLRAGTSTQVIPQASAPARSLGASPSMRRVEALLDGHGRGPV